MPTSSELQARLDEIEAILARGVSSASIDGLRTDYDLDALAKERDRLERRLVALGSASSFRRVVFKNA